MNAKSARTNGQSETRVRQIDFCTASVPAALVGNPGVMSSMPSEAGVAVVSSMAAGRPNMENSGPSRRTQEVHASSKSRQGTENCMEKSLAESFQLEMFEHPDMTNPDYPMESSEATRTCSDPFTTAGWDLSRVTQKAASVLSVPCVGISIRCELAIHIGRHQKSSYQCYLHGGGEGSRHVVFSISWQ